MLTLESWTRWGPSMHKLMRLLACAAPLATAVASTASAQQPSHRRHDHNARRRRPAALAPRHRLHLQGQRLRRRCPQANEQRSRRLWRSVRRLCRDPVRLLGFNAGHRRRVGLLRQCQRRRPQEMHLDRQPWLYRREHRRQPEPARQFRLRAVQDQDRP
jgi:hypothetical protein